MHEQTWDPERYARNARFVADLGAPLIDLLAPQPGERILDLGCGDGALTERLAASGCTVVGVDGSAEQIAAAKKRGLDAHVMNGEALTFNHEFDAVFSNAALHWMKRADAVIEGVRRGAQAGRALRRGNGRVRLRRQGPRGDQGRSRAPRHLRRTARPLVFSHRRGLRRTTERARLYHRFAPPLRSTDGTARALTAWLETFGEPFTSALPPSEQDELRQEVEASLRPTLCGADGVWRADYVRLRFAAHLPLG